MDTFLLTDGRTPSAGHLNYAAAVDLPDPLKPFGPNLLGEQLWPVTFERTLVGTRIGFSHVEPDVEMVQVGGGWIGGAG